MTKALVLDPEARAEIKAAEAYYEQQQDGLSQRFHDAVIATLAAIETSPGTGVPVAGLRSKRSVRSARVWRFPYRVYYAELSAAVRVLALAHVRRRPGYWRDRLAGADE